MLAIDIKGLKKTYNNGTVALNGINFEVNEGDFCALLGSNGAGKTTIIGIMTGLVNKSGGSVKIFGSDIENDFHMAKSLMGVVPQELNFNVFERVDDIVINQAGYYGISFSEALRRCESLLKELGLWDKRKEKSRNLSGGLKRRLMIARALVNRPRLLILDEPTAGVDVELRHSMWRFIKDLNKKGTTVLLTTHYLEEVDEMCRYASIIKKGEIITSGSVSELVGYLDIKHYVISVDNVKALEKLKQYNPARVDNHTFEVSIKKEDDFNSFFSQCAGLGMKIIDIRVKGNRMESLFLDLMRSA